MTGGGNLLVRPAPEPGHLEVGQLVDPDQQEGDPSAARNRSQRTPVRLPLACGCT